MEIIVVGLVFEFDKSLIQATDKSIWHIPLQPVSSDVS